jgi:Fe2+ or Zn2+ uptake regulation protein
MKERANTHGTEALLKNIGMKATKQRQLVLSILHAKKGPMTVDHMVTKTGIGFATLYRILEVFEKAGLVRKVDLRGNSFFYEINDAHHHHIVCTACGGIEEIDVCGIDKLLPRSKKFKIINEHSLEFFGICTTCAQS